ncbi:UNVERIFIED_CONTAM: hypothetical protein RMT77_019641 [Armadillidium vulgare]
MNNGSKNELFFENVSHSNEKPTAIVIATTWRSGSTFVYDIFDSHPDIFLHYEPLHFSGVKTFYKQNSLKERLEKYVHSLMKCKYEEDYMKAVVRTDFTLLRNRKLTQCEKNMKNKSICYDTEYLENTCKSYKWIGMKLIRLGLRSLKSVLEDNSMNVYVVFLVRDPRATMNSRMQVRFCKSKYCSDPNILCSNLNEDLKAYSEFSRTFPGRVLLLRYEDLCLNIFETTKTILKTLNITFHSDVENFLRTHSAINQLNSVSTFRKSKEQLLDWTKEINLPLLERVQNSCPSVMKTLGYQSVTSLVNISVTNVLSEISLLV